MPKTRCLGRATRNECVRMPAVCRPPGREPVDLDYSCGVNADALRFVSLSEWGVERLVTESKEMGISVQPSFTRIRCCCGFHAARCGTRRVHRFGGGQSSPGRRGVGGYQRLQLHLGRDRDQSASRVSVGHRIKGSGKRISYQAAAVQGGGLCAVKPQFCNWRMISVMRTRMGGRIRRRAARRTMSASDIRKGRLLSRRCLTTVRRVRRSM